MLSSSIAYKLPKPLMPIIVVLSTSVLSTNAYKKSDFQWQIP